MITFFSYKDRELKHAYNVDINFYLRAFLLFVLIQKVTKKSSL